MTSTIATSLFEFLNFRLPEARNGRSELVEQWLRYQNVFQVKPKTVVYAYDP